MLFVAVYIIPFFVNQISLAYKAKNYLEFSLDYRHAYPRSVRVFYGRCLYNNLSAFIDLKNTEKFID